MGKLGLTGLLTAGLLAGCVSQSPSSNFEWGSYNVMQKSWKNGITLHDMSWLYNTAQRMTGIYWNVGGREAPKNRGTYVPIAKEYVTSLDETQIENALKTPDGSLVMFIGTFVSEGEERDYGIPRGAEYFELAYLDKDLKATI